MHYAGLHLLDAHFAQQVTHHRGTIFVYYALALRELALLTELVTREEQLLEVEVSRNKNKKLVAVAQRVILLKEM